MRVLVCGSDGYLGWSLVQHLAGRGHVVGGVDSLLRRKWVEEMGSWSAVPIASPQDRLDAFRARYKTDLVFYEGDLTDYDLVEQAVYEFEPDAVVQLGECPSAPYSMIDVDHAVFVQTNNIVGTFNILFALHDHCSDAHLLKLGTMGEYGTPSVPIPEGFFEVEYGGRRDRLPFPRQAGSWYHWSKVHGSNNVMFACKLWGLRSTDVMQGVVFGSRTDEMNGDNRLCTRLDFDQAFGTAINRFCCQALVGHPITPFGKGHQKRGFLPLRDSMQCLTLAIENPPAPGEYRVFNQFEEVYDLTQLAIIVQRVAAELGFESEIRNVEDPRVELEEHYYEPEHRRLLELGYQPTHDIAREIRLTMEDLQQYRDRIEAKRAVLVPDIRWSGERRKVRFLNGRDGRGDVSSVLADRARAKADRPQRQTQEVG
jgi:UDP-sulfoquinovose synthase